MIRQLSIAILFTFSIGLYAQNPDTVIVRKQDSVTIRKQDSLNIIQQDSVPARKNGSGTLPQDTLNIRKDSLTIRQNPLSGRKQDSLNLRQDATKKTRIIRQWHLSPDFSEEVPVLFDTVFSLFHRYRVAEKYSPFNATLGNYGLPFYQINFFDRVTDPDKFLYSYYYPFMYVPERAVFMDTQVPFTELLWTNGGPKETSEQTFRIRHSQNANRFLNFGLIYDIIYSLGQYNYQRAENKNFTFYSSYAGPRYKLYFSAGVNTMKGFENGGIVSRSDLIIPKKRDIPVNLGGLNKAVSLLKNRNILLVQRYTIGGESVGKNDSIPQKRSGFFGLSGTFSHIIQLENNRRTYSDSYPAGNFYDSTYINTSITFDSLYAHSIKNTLRFDLTTDETRKFRLGAGFGYRNEEFKYSQIKPTHDTLILADTASWTRRNNILLGRLYNNIGDKFRWVATGELFLTGYRAGDFDVRGEIVKAFDWKKGRASWIINGGLSNRQPSIWYGQWGSNHFEWSTNMDKELRLDFGTSYVYPARHADIGINYAIIDNYTDFDTLALPSQHSGGLSVAALSIKKEFRVWKVHFNTNLLVQKSSNTEVLDLPLATFRAGIFIEHLFVFKSTSGRLNTQLGADVTYHTLYHPYSYMPATGRFYRQQQTYTGEYPFINLFFNFKIKRTRVFFMFDHMNAGLKRSDYDMVPFYPMNIRMLRYGLAWTFYN